MTQKEADTIKGIAANLERLIPQVRSPYVVHAMRQLAMELRKLTAMDKM